MNTLHSVLEILNTYEHWEIKTVYGSGNNHEILIKFGTRHRAKFPRDLVDLIPGYFSGHVHNSTLRGILNFYNPMFAKQLMAYKNLLS